MDKPIVKLDLSSMAEGQRRYTELTLPATDYELIDALDALQAADDRTISYSAIEYCGFPWLAPYIEGCGGLFGLNALARELSKLDEYQSVAFGGLLKMEERKREPIKLPRLMALAVSAKAADCHVISVADDAELGRFYAENGFCPELDELPDPIFEKLDFAKIGRETRMAEGGVFIRPTGKNLGGYVVQDSDLAPDVKQQIRTPRKPKYAILLEVSKGFFYDPRYENDVTVRLTLPVPTQELDAALDKLEAASWDEVEITCVDCCVPVLIGRIENSNNITCINNLARHLAEMPQDQISKFKAMLDIQTEYTLQDALDITNRLEDYAFYYDVRTPEEAALKELRASLDEQAVRELRPFLNLYGYGNAVLQKMGAELTPYGMIKAVQAQPVQEPEQSPVQGGMEMM